MPIRLVFLCVLLNLSTSAFAQDAPVTGCDKYAASDIDPQRKVTGVPFDKVNSNLAVPACEVAVRQYPNSTRFLFQLGRAYQKANKFEAALQQYRKGAVRGSALAQNNIGVLYESGLGVTQDYEQAIAWYRKAAEQGLAAAQFALGVAYENGRGVPKDGQQAMFWYRKAADRGNAIAQDNLRRLVQEPDEAATLNNQIVQLYKQGRYSEAIPLGQRLLAIWEKALGPDHPDVANSSNILGFLYRFQGRYADAEPLLKRALSIREKALGPDHPDVAQSLNNLANLYEAQGRYTDAEPLYKRSLAIREKALGPDHPDVALGLNNLAVLYIAQGRYSDVEPFYKRALAIYEKAFGPDHPIVAGSQNNLATLYNDQGRYAEAQPLYERSLAIREQALGPDHPDVATSLNSMGLLYDRQGRYAEAEPLYKRSLAIREKALGPDHPDVASSLNNLAEFYRTQGRYYDAEPLYQRSLAIEEKVLGSDHADVALSLNNLAELYRSQGRYADAEPLLKRALSIHEKALGSDHSKVALSLNNLAALYYLQGRYAEAEPIYKRAMTIREKSLGSDHPDVAASLNNLAELYRIQGRYGDAEPLYKRSLAIKEKVLGSDHPDVALLLNNLALLYDSQGRYADAEPLLTRALSIREKAFGPDHAEVAAALNNLAELYRSQGRYADAEPIYKRSLTVWEKALGPDNPEVAASLNNLGLLYDSRGQYADAELMFKRSLAINEKTFGPDHPGVAIALINLASLYGEQARFAEAEPLHKRALAINEKALGPNHSDVAAALNNLAVLYGAQARFSEAEPLYQRSLAIREKALRPDHPDVAFALNNLADLYRAQGRYAEALPIVQRTISQNTARKPVAFSILYGSRSDNLISPKQALDASYAVLQRSVSSAAGEALSKLAARFAAGTDELSQFVRKDQDLAAEGDRLDKSIITAVSKPPVERNQAMEGQIRKRIGEIKSERDALLEVFKQRFPDYVALSRPQPLTIEETQALIADDEAVVIIDLDQKSYVWVITKDRAEWKELSVSAEDMSAGVGFLRTGLDSLKPFDRSLAYQLYRLVLGPIEGIIAQKTRLSFVLDGALTSLPPQVLITADPNGENLNSVDWLVRKYAVTVLPSIASLKILREEKSTVGAIKPMIGFGDPVFDRTTPTPGRQHVSALNRSLTSFYRGVTADTKALAEALPALPETADELRAIAKILGAKSEDIKLGEAASVTTVKKEPLADYRVVYFATHALVAGEVEKFAKVKAEPALVLSIPVAPSEEDDGLLTASEVAMLKLNADFVVLSACNTAAGDKPGAEALSGLARAFFYAGAKSLVVSHWEVDSEATVALMDGLFEALKANPHLSHAEALRMSMLRMITSSSDPELAQPKFWAPFVVVGEPQKR